MATVNFTGAGAQTPTPTTLQLVDELSQRLSGLIAQGDIITGNGSASFHAFSEPVKADYLWGVFTAVRDVDALVQKIPQTLAGNAGTPCAGASLDQIDELTKLLAQARGIVSLAAPYEEARDSVADPRALSHALWAVQDLLERAASVVRIN